MQVEFWLFLVAETSLYVNKIAETITEDQTAFIKVCVKYEDVFLFAQLSLKEKVTPIWNSGKVNFVLITYFIIIYNIFCI